MSTNSPTVREWASGALATVRAVDKLHTLWLADSQDGLVPIVTIDDYLKIPGQYGSTFEPVFKIVS